MESSPQISTAIAWPAQLAQTLRAMHATIADAWARLTETAMDADERYLRNARDLVDLELRLKQLERGSVNPSDFDRR